MIDSVRVISEYKVGFQDFPVTVLNVACGKGPVLQKAEWMQITVNYSTTALSFANH